MLELNETLCTVCGQLVPSSEGLHMPSVNNAFVCCSCLHVDVIVHVCPECGGESSHADHLCLDCAEQEWLKGLGL